jgi:hypothetical protein
MVTAVRHAWTAALVRPNGRGLQLDFQGRTHPQQRTLVFRDPICFTLF